jgi:hypothetical protein
MKNSIFKILLGSVLLMTGLSSCEKDENRVILEGGTPPVLTASVSNTIPLSFVTSNNAAIKFDWTNPGYRFNTGVVSQNVTYYLEIDTVGANFTNPNRHSLTITNDLNRSITVGELNDYFLNELLLVPGIPHNIEFRLKSTLPNNSVALLSNVLQYTVTPYAIPPKVAPPSTGKLFITGNATPAGWQCACGEPENTAQQFTMVTPTFYVLPSIVLTGGNSYLFLPKYADWGAKYGFDGPGNTNNVNGDNFKADGGDMKAPDASGAYKIEVDFQRGKFTVTKL